MRACRPTSMMMVPRILNMAYETYKLKRAALLAAAGPEGGDGAGLVESEDDDPAKRALIARLDRQARDYVRDEVFGGRLLFQLVGSAPSSPEVMDCIRDCNGVPFVEGYGSTGTCVRADRVSRSVGACAIKQDGPPSNTLVQHKPPQSWAASRSTTTSARARCWPGSWWTRLSSATPRGTSPSPAGSCW